jgi:hypothetical protein
MRRSGGRQGRGSGTDRQAARVAGATIGAVLAILAGSVLFPAEVGPLAYLAVGVVGSTAGSAMGVLALVARRPRPGVEQDPPRRADG